MGNNYFLYHLHSDLSNGVTNIDSVTKYKEYIDKAKECGMTSLAFSEHGSVFEWWHKKCDIEAAGMKYVHAVETYVTESLEEKIRDNYHCVLLAKNKAGVFELNKLISTSFCREDNHYYYTPRISFEELKHTSDNILITTACIGGPLSKGNEDFKERFIDFLLENNNRVWLEIGHHLDPKQVQYNQYLYSLNKKYGLRLIAGTDTHCLNDTHVKGRKILQLSKNIHFSDEDNWDLTFKTYDQLVAAYSEQNAIPEKVYLDAIENTNILADQIESFNIDKSTKYPHIYEDSATTFRQKINTAIKNHPYINKRYTIEEINKTVDEEFAVYKKTGSIDFMLLQNYIREWERENGILCGYGRGSVSGSFIAYILGITQMDSKRFDLNFFRFANPERVTNADIDTDYSSKDRDRVKQFLLRDKMNLPQIKTSEIITFNTVAEKGAVRDVARAMDIPLSEVADICDQIGKNGVPEKLRKKYPELFEYVDIVSGTIVSIGTHPSGVLVSDLDLTENVGTCTTSTSDYPISMLNMKELDDLFFVKLDILGLDNIGVINETCKMVGIDRADPDNTDLEDMDVWEKIRDDTTLIFQWESEQAQAYLRKFMSDETLNKVRPNIPNFSMLKWLSLGNGLIRPACSSYRNEVADGIFYDNGLEELNQFLAKEMGHICMQETIMQFLVQFCGYSQAESDNVRRAIAKKKGTETLLPEIESRFIKYTSQNYNVSKEKCEDVIKPFLQVILDASDYGFSWNHSDSYSCTGYICGYLRHYYPYEFVTSALNIFKDNEDKVRAITEYAQNNGIRIIPPKFGVSKDQYMFDKNQKVIAKGVASIKYLNEQVPNDLYELSKRSYDYFVDLLWDINRETSANSRQLDILIKIDYFSDFGNSKELLRINDMFNLFKQGAAKTIKKDKVDITLSKILERYANGVTKSGAEAKSYTIIDMRGLLRECEQYIRSLQIEDFDYKNKMITQEELLGYIDLTTGREEDRKKLLLTDVVPLRSKTDDTIWAYALFTRSIGSGKSGRLTLRTKLYENNPVQKNDIIYAENITKNKAGYWYLLDYYRIVGDNIKFYGGGRT